MIVSCFFFLFTENACPCIFSFSSIFLCSTLDSCGRLMSIPSWRTKHCHSSLIHLIFRITHNNEQSGQSRVLLLPSWWKIYCSWRSSVLSVRYNSPIQSHMSCVHVVHCVRTCLRRFPSSLLLMFPKFNLRIWKYFQMPREWESVFVCLSFCTACCFFNSILIPVWKST